MKRGNKPALIAAGLIVCAIIFIAGCARDSDIADEPEITVESLSGDYAQQLIRDGAELIFGSISLRHDETGEVWTDITEKEYIEDPSQPNGFYIAYKNLESTYQLSSEARATFIGGGSDKAEAMNADEFAAAVERDNSEYGADNPDYQENKLYDIYVMGDQIELLIARYIP